MNDYVEMGMIMIVIIDDIDVIVDVLKRRKENGNKWLRMRFRGLNIKNADGASALISLNNYCFYIELIQLSNFSVGIYLSTK